MKQSIFKKELSVHGKLRVVNAEVIVTMNCGTRPISGMDAGTHGDSEKQIPMHKIEAFIDGQICIRVCGLTSEEMVLDESKKVLETITTQITSLANENAQQTFTDKMNELFS